MWVELTSPLWDMFTDSTDIPTMKRWLAVLEGGLLPIISLTSLHFFVKYENPDSPKKEEDSPGLTEIVENNGLYGDFDSPKEEVDSPELDNDQRIEQLTDLQKEVNRVWENVHKNRKKNEPNEDKWEELRGAGLDEPLTSWDEPTALANSEYREKNMTDLDLDDEPPILVEEENPEDEINIYESGTTETINDRVSLVTDRNLGQELSKTWSNIVKTNNSIGRI